MILKRERMHHLKKNIPAMAIIICLLIAVAVTTGVSFSRYVTSTSGSDNARVARYAFEVVDTETKGEFALLLDELKAPGDSMDISFVVTNKDSNGVCEVNQEYKISYRFTGNLPLKLNLISNTTNKESDILFIEGIQNGMLPAAQETIHTYTLRITWSENETNPIYADEIDQIIIQVNGEQTISEK